MPRIRLRIEEESAITSCRFTDPDHPTSGIQQIPVLRLVTTARIEPRPGQAGMVRMITAFIDTGAWLSVIETRAWQDFEAAGLLERLPLVDSSTHSAAVGGRISDYQLGRVWVSLYEVRLDQPAISLPAVPVIAQLLLNPKCQLPSPIILGLHLGVLDGRKLTRRVVPPIPSPLSTDRGSLYGQDWHLETP